MTAGIPNHLQHICLASFSARSLVFGMSLRVCVCFAIFAFGGRVPRSWGPGLLGMGLGFRGLGESPLQELQLQILRNSGN